MSADQDKIRRQSKGIRDKERFELLLEPANKRYVEDLAAAHRTSKAKIINAILRDKPQPNETLLT